MAALIQIPIHKGRAELLLLKHYGKIRYENIAAAGSNQKRVTKYWIDDRYLGEFFKGYFNTPEQEVIDVVIEARRSVSRSSQPPVY